MCSVPAPEKVWRSSFVSEQRYTPFPREIVLGWAREVAGVLAGLPADLLISQPLSRTIFWLSRYPDCYCKTCGLCPKFLLIQTVL